MQEWNEVRTDEDIEKIPSLYEGVLVSVSYDSGSRGEEKISHHGFSEGHTASVIADQPWSGERVEFFFTGVRYCAISGFTEGDIFKEIDMCRVSFRTDLLGRTRDDRLIVWTDGGDVDLKNMQIDLRESGQTFIIAEKLKWRYINEYDHKQEL